MSKKMTVNQVQEILNEHKESRNDLGASVALQVGSTAIVFDTWLSFEDTRMFVDRVVETVINKNGYFPEMQELMFFVTALQMMTGVNVPTKNVEVNGETVKVLDLKKLQEWFHVVSNSWRGLVCQDVNLAALFRIVNEKVEWEKERLQRETPMQEFFRRVVDTIDHLEGEHGIDLVKLADMMQLQVPDKVSDTEEAITVQYGADGVMSIG